MTVVYDEMNENDLWAAISAHVTLSPVEDFDPARHITYTTFCDRYGCGTNTAKVELERLVKAGVLVQVEVKLANGKRGKAFRMA